MLMLSRSLPPVTIPYIRRLAARNLRLFSSASIYREAGLASSKVNYGEKYAEKLQKRAHE